MTKFEVNQLNKQQKKAVKLLVIMLVMFALSFVYFVFSYYNSENLNKLDEVLISFERNGDTVVINSDYDVPFITNIRYTTDGSVPVKDSPIYDEEIHLNNTGRNGTVIRAAVFRGNKASEVYTKTFFTSQSSLNEGVYTVCISTDSDNLYSYETGIMSLGAPTQEEANANEAIPKDPRGPNHANYYGKGIEWERPVTVEIYSSQGQQILVQNAGVRLAGANSRRFPVKSLSLFPRTAYDTDGVFRLNIFDQYTALLENQVTTYNHIDLRSGGNNFYYTMLPDTIMRQIAYEGGFDVVGTAVPAAVYINGQYYALMWIQPDYCRRNITEMAGLDKNAVIRTVKGFEGSATDGTQEGYDDYKAMYEFATIADFNDPQEREKLEKILDIDNCLMYYFLEIYASNNDWPQNNYGLWRCIDPALSDPDNKYADGRWRYMLYDLDNAFSTFVDQIDGFDYLLHHQYSPMFVNLMKSEVYRQKFVNIVCDFMSTSASSENALEIYNNLKNLIEPEMQWRSQHSAPIDFDEGYNDIMHLKLNYYISNRETTVKEKLITYFGASDIYNLDISKVPAGATVHLNTRNIAGGEKYSGSYYKEYPAVLSCTTADGYTLDYWLINGVKYYDSQMLLDSAVTGAGDCTVEIHIKQTASAPKLKTLAWGGIARYTEIYNPGTEAVSLDGCYISADEKGVESYALPDITLEPGNSFRVYFNDDKSASIGAYICGINIKEGKTIYLLENGQVTDYVFVPEFIEGHILEKSESDGSWKYRQIKEDGQ